MQILISRVITAELANYSTNALHVYRLNADVDLRNSLMLNNLATESQQYIIKTSDAIGDQTSHISLSNLSEKRSETGGLHSLLKLAISACVLTTNVDVSDGLVNGSRGEVLHVVTNTDHAVTNNVLVKFDNHQVGCKAKPLS